MGSEQGGQEEHLEEKNIVSSKKLVGKGAAGEMRWKAREHHMS